MSNPWSDRESKDRQEKFLKEYDELVKTYEVELMAFPQFMPSGQRGFNITGTIIPVDKKNRPIPSPMSDDKGIIK